MLERWKLGLLAIALATTPLAGCASAPARRDRVYVRVAPPPERREVIVESPGRDYVWQRGHWVWQGGGYGWVEGRWVRTDREHRWVEGRWVHDRYGWYYIDGHRR